MASLIDLFFQNFSVFSDQEVHPARGLVLIDINAILARRIAAPVTQQGKSNSNLVGKRFIGERTIHAHTQDLGVGIFQLFQVLLEVFHLLRSTTGESEDEERQDNVFLAAISLSFTCFKLSPSKYRSVKSGAISPTLGIGGATVLASCADKDAGTLSASSNPATRVPETFLCIALPPNCTLAYRVGDLPVNREVLAAAMFRIAQAAYKPVQFCSKRKNRSSGPKARTRRRGCIATRIANKIADMQHRR